MLQEDPCVCVLLWRVWRAKRARQAKARKELFALLNNPVFLDGPAGQVVHLCGSTLLRVFTSGCLAVWGCARSSPLHSGVRFRCAVSRAQVQEFAKIFHIELAME